VPEAPSVQPGGASSLTRAIRENQTVRSSRLVHDSDGLNTAAWPVPDDNFVTPVGSFFTRSHAAVPDIAGESWRLEVTGLVRQPRRFSLAELSQVFPRRQVTATLVCAGLRRDEFLSLGPLPGELPWGPEPAGTGEWTGVALGDLLRMVGVAPEARYVELIGLDQVERHGRRFGFGGSIDVSKALSDEALLATDLNGAPLPPEHGFPIRAVIPGWIGARSVKWLGQINLRADPTPNYFQSQAYRLQRQVDPANPRDVSGGIVLTEVPVNAVILEPLSGQRIAPGRVRLRGWAMGSGGRRVMLVEVSVNGGTDWVPARVLPQESAWTWTFWEAAVELAPGHHLLLVRATDSSGAMQPPGIKDTWNVKGYCNNAWHRVTVVVE
jgi:sulfite oxidase